MSDAENQYNSLETQIVPDQTRVTGNLTEKMFNYLKEASPWLRFLGILGFISFGFICLGGLAALIAFFAISDLSEELAGIFPIWLFTIIYIPCGVLVFFPSRFMYLFGTKIRRYQFSNSDEDLEAAFKNNKSLWKFFGILTIVYLAMIPVMLIVTVVGAVALSAAGILN